MSRYAKDTTVSSAKSRDEIERTLTRYGASGFMYGWQEDSAVVAFKMGNRSVKFTLPLPDRNNTEYTHTPSRGTRRSEEQAAAAWLAGNAGARLRWSSRRNWKPSKLELQCLTRNFLPISSCRTAKRWDSSWCRRLPLPMRREQCRPCYRHHRHDRPPPRRAVRMDDVEQAVLTMCERPPG